MLRFESAKVSAAANAQAIGIPAALFPAPELRAPALHRSGGFAGMYFFAWLRWALLSGTSVLRCCFSIFYFRPVRFHTRRDDDRNQDPLGPDDAFADGGSRRRLGRHRVDSDAPGFSAGARPRLVLRRRGDSLQAL